MKLAIAILALAIAIPAIAGDTAWYNADLQRLQWQRPGKVTVGGTDYGPNPHPDLVVAAGWQSLALDCAWTDTVTDWEESPPVRCMTQEELDARAADQAAAIAEAEARQGPPPEVFVPLLDENGEAVGTARLVAFAGSLAVVASTNSASPQVVWELQRAQILSQLANIAESRATAAAARLAIKQTVLAGDLAEEDLGQIVDLWPAWAAGVSYALDEILRHEGTLYKVVQAHTSQPDWAPPDVPALFAEITPPGLIAEWVQPTGAQDTYSLGALVTHVGQVWESTVDNNSWEPGVYGWVEVE